MRLIRYTMTAPVKAVVLETASEHRLDPDYALDLFSMLRLKGSGLPTDDRIKKMARYRAKREKVSELSMNIVMKKRTAALRKIGQSAIFKGYMTAADPVNAFRSLVVSIDTLQKKIRQSQCIACPHVKVCQFGQQYGERVVDISKAVDPDFKKKVHADCPHAPDIDKTNTFTQAVQQMSEMLSDENEAEREIVSKKNPSGADDMEDLVLSQQEADDDAGLEDGDDEGSDESLSEDPPAFVVKDEPEKAPKKPRKRRKSGYNATHNGSNILPAENVINSLTSAQLALFDLGVQFSSLLDAAIKGKFSPSPVTEKDSDVEKMKEFSDVSKLTSSQHALPQEIYDAKLDKKALNKKQHVKREDKKKLLYVLIDASGSMGGWLNQANAVTRSELSMILSVALSKRLEADNGWMYVRFFANDVSRLLAGTDADSYKEVRRMITACGFNGGGTSIAGALAFAKKDIAAAKDAIASSEILCITDCEDSLDEKSLRASLGDTPFNVLDVSGTRNASNASGVLKAVAQKYFKASGTELDPAKIVALL